MKHVAAQCVPKLLNCRRMSIAQELCNDVNGDPDLIKRVLTGEKSWVYGYKIETKVQLSQYKKKSLRESN